MAGGKIFPRDMVPKSALEFTSSGLAMAIQSDAETTQTAPDDSPSQISLSASLKPILLEPERIDLKRKRSAAPVSTHELNRRARINDNERTIQERMQEMQNIFDKVEAQVPARKKRKQDELDMSEVGALTNTPRPRIQTPQEAIMRTEVVPMLPFKGYTLPQKNSKNVVYIGDRERKEGLPWMSSIELKVLNHLHENSSDSDSDSDSNSDSSDSDEEESDEDENEEEGSIVNIVGEDENHEEEEFLIDIIFEY